MSTDPTVFIVDDDAGVRKALKRLLESAGCNAQTYESAAEFLEDFDPAGAGCLLLDLRMPGINGLQLQETLVEKGSEIPIIFVTGHGDVSAAVKGIKAGALDFIEKPFDDELLLDRVREALARDAQNRQENEVASSAKTRFSRLTSREKEVLRLVAAGQSNKEIARALQISHRTVETHRFRLMQKMDAQSLSDLISVAVLCGLHDLGRG